jgi:Mg/Co/Ni transporter MgtE
MEAHRHLAARYAATHPGEVARRLESVPSQEVAELLANVEPETAVEVVEGMLPPSAAAALESMAHADLAPILERLPVARCVLVLRSVTKADRGRMIGLLPRATAAKVERLLRSSEGSAGVLAEPVPAVLTPGMDAGEALRTLEGTGGSSAYVVDEDHRLVGVIHRRDLAKSDHRARIGGLMTRQVVKLPSAASLAAVRDHRAWVDFEMLPVVDAGGVLVGVIRHKNVRRTATSRRASTAAPRRAALEGLLDLGEVYWAGLTSALEALGDRGGAR